MCALPVETLFNETSHLTYGWTPTVHKPPLKFQDYSRSHISYWTCSSNVPAVVLSFFVCILSRYHHGVYKSPSVLIATYLPCLKFPMKEHIRHYDHYHRIPFHKWDRLRKLVVLGPLSGRNTSKVWAARDQQMHDTSRFRSPIEGFWKEKLQSSYRERISF